MLDSGQWTRHKSGFQKMQKLLSFFLWEIKIKHVSELMKVYSFHSYFKTQSSSTKSTSNRGLKMGYFCYILSPRAGIDRAVIIWREVKTTVRITIFFKFFGTNAYMFPHLTVLSLLTVFQNPGLKYYCKI